MQMWDVPGCSDVLGVHQSTALLSIPPPPSPSCSCGQKTCQPCGEISGPSKYHPWTLYPSLLFLELRSSSLGTVTLGISTCKL